MLVVHDLVPDIDRRAVFRDGPLDDLDGPVDPGAEAARAGQKDLQGRLDRGGVIHGGNVRLGFHSR